MIAEAWSVWWGVLCVTGEQHPHSMEGPHIFDMDEVLVHSQPAIARVESDILAKRGVMIDPEEISRKFTGMSTKLMFAMYVPEKEVDSCLQEKKDALKTKEYAESLETVAGSTTYLRSVSGKYPVAIASGSPRETIANVLETLGIADCVTAYVAEEEAERGKPHPDLFLEAARRLGIDPKTCVVIEDSPYGIAAANAAGMFTIGIATSHTREQLSEADVVVASFTDLL